MKNLISPLKVAAVVALLIATGVAQASITVYVTQASYLSAITAPGVDSFDNLTYSPYATPITRTAGAYGYTASSGPNSGFWGGSNGLGDGYLSTNNPEDTVTFTNFSSTVRGVGANVFGSGFTGFFAPGAAMHLTATDAQGTVSKTILSSTLGSFVGFVSTGTLSSVTVDTNWALGTNVWPTVNNLTLGTVSAVPEPATYGMLLAGLGLMGAMLRRRKH